jgi:hypothetical protein
VGAPVQVAAGLDGGEPLVIGDATGIAEGSED